MAIVVERSNRSTGAAEPPQISAVPDPTVAPSPLGTYLDGLYRRHRGASDGAVATYIPELGDADPAWFGVAVATLDGRTHAVGDADHRFTIQSISKPLTYGLLLDDLGEAAVRARIGVEPTGDAFNAITLAPTTGTPLNPMVNAGAIAAAGLVPSRDGVDARRPHRRGHRAVRRPSAGDRSRPSSSRSGRPATATGPSATCCAPPA